jgi:hypothetical protein
MKSSVEISWVNHASFIYSDGETRLLCDPWLTGSAFNNGWRQISDTRFTHADFNDVTHLWISHQHPDHFAPQDLKRVAPADKQRIAALYQELPDKLVVSWLKSAGYKNVRELQIERWVPISTCVEIMCGSHADDSWLAIRGHGITLLNVNDCVLKQPDDIQHIKDLVGTVDVFFTQFSYAQWVGNPGDTQRRQMEAAEKLQRIRLQCEIFNPTTVVPFASFIYFSSSENFFLNDAINRIKDVADFIEHELKRNVVVLYPGDRWTVGQVVHWQTAAERYEVDLQARLQAGPVDSPASIALSTFVSQANDFVRRIRRKNPMIRALLRDETTFYLSDHSVACRLNANGLQVIDAKPDNVDLVTSAENVVYAMRTPWGGNTLHVSGRFQSYRPGAHLRFFRVMLKLHYYNRNVVNLKWLVSQCARVQRGVSRRLSTFAKARATAVSGAKTAQ